MKYNSKVHHRRSIRLKGYDYSKEGLYFITLCCQEKKHLFGHIQNGVMCLNAFGSIAYQSWQETTIIRPNIKLEAFIVMPNHIHGILEIAYSKGEKNQDKMGQFKSPSQTLGAIIRGYKGSTTKRIKEYIYREDSLGSTGELQFAPTSRKSSPASSAPTSRKSSPASSAPTSRKSSPASSAPTSRKSSPASRKSLPIESIDLRKSIWQRDYYDQIIRDAKAYQNISNYIINNPIKWQEDKLR